MKKFFVTALLLISFGISGFSQSGVFSGCIGSRILRETGWIIRPEIGLNGGKYSGKAPETVSVLAFNSNFGNQLTSHIYVGGGIACFVDPDSKYNSYSGLYERSNVESLYASFRWYWFDGWFSPFLDLDLGLGRYHYFRSYYDWNYGGFWHEGYQTRFLPYLSLAVGCNIKSFDFEIAVPFNISTLGVVFGYNFLIKK